MDFKLKQRGKHILSIFVALVFLFFVLEGVFRIALGIKRYYSPQLSETSTKYGWRTIPNQTHEKIYGGVENVKHSTTEYGFRKFGNINSPKKKLLVLGDSYTHAYTANDGNAYFDYLEEHSDSLEVFAYGCGGYGTLQEYLILDEYFDLIQPDFILWQFCSNDIGNNNHDWEAASFTNNLNIRPYLENKKIITRFPIKNKGILNWLIVKSEFLKWITIRVQIIKRTYEIGSYPEKVDEIHPLFIDSKKITLEVMTMVKDRINGIPLIGFSVNEEWEEVFEEMCFENNFQFISGVSLVIEEAREKGERVDLSPYDGHWNDVGHGLAGKKILNYLVENNFIKKISY